MSYREWCLSLLQLLPLLLHTYAPHRACLHAGKA